MEFHLITIGARTAGELQSIERRTGQLWTLATVIMCLLGVAVVLVDITRAGFYPQQLLFGIPRGFFRAAIVLCIVLTSAYFWEKVRELRQINAYLISGLQRYANSLEKRNDELKALNSLSEKLIGSVDMDSGLQTALDIAMKAVQASRGSILIYDRESDEFTIKCARGFSEELPAGHRIRGGDSILGWIARHGQPVVLNNSKPDPRFSKLMKRADEVFSSIGVPLCVGGEVIGVVNVSNRTTKQDFTQSDLEVLSAFAVQAATLIERTELYSELRCHVEKLEEALRVCDDSKSLTTTDSLTGLGNRRYFDYLIEAEYQRAKRYSRSLCLVLFDLDGLREFNERCGNAAGDLLLKRLGQLLRSGIRSEGSASRCGGDEFAVILPECESPNARAVAERLRCAIQRDAQELAGDNAPQGVTASFGIACFPSDTTSKDELIHAARTALNRAKKEGRNQVCVYTPSGFRDQLQIRTGETWSFGSGKQEAGSG